MVENILIIILVSIFVFSVSHSWLLATWSARQDAHRDSKTFTDTRAASLALNNRD